MGTAETAVAHVLRRIKDDPRIAYHFGHTESLALLCAAHAEAQGLNAEQFKREFQASLLTEAPRCRSGECSEKAQAAAA
jgi:hypothetical protein